MEDEYGYEEVLEFHYMYYDFAMYRLERIVRNKKWRKMDKFPKKTGMDEKRIYELKIEKCRTWKNKSSRKHSAEKWVEYLNHFTEKQNVCILLLTAICAYG